MTGKQAAALVEKLVARGLTREYIAYRLAKTVSSFDKWAKGVQPRTHTQRKLAALAWRSGIEVENGKRGAK